MFPTPGVEFVLYATAAFLAVWSLVRLMRQRRDQLVSELQSHAERERQRRALEARRRRSKVNSGPKKAA